MDSLPLQYALPRLPAEVSLVFRFFGGGSIYYQIVEPSLEFSALVVGIYFLAAAFIALAYFWYADVSRRVG